MASTTMGDFPISALSTARTLTYHYIHIIPQAPKHYVLILHGFPCIPTDFHHQIAHLSNLGYGILAPYLLGYSPSSTPKDPNLYRLKPMCADIVSLLDHLAITSPVHAIGHDWGSTLLSRLTYYHPTRLSSKQAYLTLAPVPFGQPFDLDMVNQMTQQHWGYPAVGYQKFFMDNYENGRAASLLEEKHARMEMLMFSRDSGRLWKEYVCRLGGLEGWLLGDMECEVIEGLTTEHQEKREKTFCPGERETQVDGKPGYAGALQWYVSFNRNLNVEDERAEREDWEKFKTDKEVLVVVCNKDPISTPDMQFDLANSYVKDASKQLKIEHLDSGHFVMYEQANLVNDLLAKFFEDV